MVQLSRMQYPNISNNRLSRLARSVVFFSAVALLSILGEATVKLASVDAQASTFNKRVQRPLPEEYWAAVNDAREPEPNEIFRHLTAITPSNENLVWDDKGRILAITWSGWSGYNEDTPSILTQDVWVTVVPDLQNFCKEYTQTDEIPLAARLNQLLGLPPEENNTRRVVELWVHPQYLFRPSPDPDITDHEAEISFRPWSAFTSVSVEYQKWFSTQYTESFFLNGRPFVPDLVAPSGPIPYPWTQLGYTYDWGNAADWDAIDPDRPDEVGLSEFIIRQHSPILVGQTPTAEEYCSK